MALSTGLFSVDLLGKRSAARAEVVLDPMGQMIATLQAVLPEGFMSDDYTWGDLILRTNVVDDRVELLRYLEGEWEIYGACALEGELSELLMQAEDGDISLDELFRAVVEAASFLEASPLADETIRDLDSLISPGDPTVREEVDTYGLWDPTASK